jgi:hypothetical protein
MSREETNGQNKALMKDNMWNRLRDFLINSVHLFNFLKFCETEHTLKNLSFLIPILFSQILQFTSTTKFMLVMNFSVYFMSVFRFKAVRNL